MKKIMLLIFIMGIAHITNSQTEKGRFIYGGSFQLTNRFSIDNNKFGLYYKFGFYNYFGFNLAPQFGYFPVKNFAILGIFDLGYTGYSNTGSRRFSIEYGLGPEFRYYVVKTNIKFYVFTNILPKGNHYDQLNVYGPSFVRDYFSFTTSTGPGLAIFPSSSFVIQTSLFFNTNTSFIGSTIINGVKSFLSETSLSVGLNVTFNGLFSIKPKTK